mmetsp:Transcript_3753/g.6914  ORF Transcript_3753/g.6914 Transcript_3753/m.6914 type:complete len:82 (-) Transcript_3753:1397-1642(-)
MKFFVLKYTLIVDKKFLYASFKRKQLTTMYSPTFHRRVSVLELVVITRTSTGEDVRQAFNDVACWVISSTPTAATSTPTTR